MPKASAPLDLTEDQVLYFRARRVHLAGPGAPDAAAAAASILGAQSQQLAPSLLALSARTKGRPTAAQLGKELFEAPRRLVRTWGQRDTLFVFDPRTEWADVVAARGDWELKGRRIAMPTKAAVDKAQKVLEKAGEPLTRRDFFSIVPAKLVREAAEGMGPGDPAKRLAAFRLFWKLAHRGDACVAGKVKAEQFYVGRRAWFPELRWPSELDPPARAAARLTRRYLSSYGPATVQDVAHFFGANVRNARVWMGTLEKEEELTAVGCGDRKGLVALTADASALRKKPPTKAGEWPVRMLPLWDSILMGHADKTWTVPDPADRKLIWKKGAFVTATVHARGRVVATWSHAVKRKGLQIQVRPLSGWRASKHAAGVRREAAAVASHFGLEGVDVTIGE